MEKVQRPDGAFRRMSREQLLIDLPADIHKAAGQALEAMEDNPEATEAILSVLQAYRRTDQRAEADKRNDRARRMTISTRQPKWFYTKCRQAAHLQGLTLNAWVYAALCSQIVRQETQQSAKTTDYGYLGQLAAKLKGTY